MTESSADFTANAVSEGDHWVVDVPGIGTTEADRVEDVAEAALELVVARTHAAREDVRLDLRIV